MPDSVEKVNTTFFDKQSPIFKSEQIHEKNVLATSPGVKAASFAHLGEKRILRKMDRRLLPTLSTIILARIPGPREHRQREDRRLTRGSPLDGPAVQLDLDYLLLQLPYVWSTIEPAIKETSA